MVERVPGVLECYKFTTDEEMYSAVVFTDMQVMHLTSELSAALQDKLNIAGDDANFEKPEIFVRAHEYARGRIDALRWLLHAHEEAQKQQLTALNMERARQKYTEDIAEARTRSTQDSSPI